MFRNLFDGPHLLIVLLVILVLFGGKKLPDAARGLGRSLRIFKSEVKQLREDDDDPVAKAPLEGRVMDGESARDERARDGRATTPGSAAGAAEQADQKHSA
jgi:sec-independent protein translocase protein TatA